VENSILAVVRERATAVGGLQRAMGTEPDKLPKVKSSGWRKRYVTVAVSSGRPHKRAKRDGGGLVKGSSRRALEWH